MAIYYFTIFTLTGFGYLLAKKETLSVTCYMAVTFVSLTLLASFRYAIGFDYFSYRNIYHMVAGWTFPDIFTYYWHEPAFYLVCKIFNLFSCPYPVFLFFINAFLIFTAVKFIYRYSQLPWMSVYLFITLQFLAYDMNLLRQSVAICFFMLCYPLIKDRKLIPFSIYIFLGGLFHNSLWFMYPLYFLLPLKNTRRFTVGMIILSVIGYLFFEPLFSIVLPYLPVKYAGYQGSYFWNSSTFAYIIPSALYTLFIYLFSNRFADSRLRNIYLNSSLYHFLISLFITKHFILERFAVYPFIFSLIAIPEIIASCKTDSMNHAKPHRFFSDYYGVLLLFLLFGSLYFGFAAAKGFHHVYPYVSLLDKSYSAPDY